MGGSAGCGLHSCARGTCRRCREPRASPCARRRRDTSPTPSFPTLARTPRAWEDCHTSNVTSWNLTVDLDLSSQLPKTCADVFFQPGVAVPWVIPSSAYADHVVPGSVPWAATGTPPPPPLSPAETETCSRPQTVPSADYQMMASTSQTSELGANVQAAVDALPDVESLWLPVPQLVPADVSAPSHSLERAAGHVRTREEAVQRYLLRKKVGSPTKTLRLCRTRPLSRCPTSCPRIGAQ
jgi:hypothetical protein